MDWEKLEAGIWWAPKKEERDGGRPSYRGGRASLARGRVLENTTGDKCPQSKRQSKAGGPARGAGFLSRRLQTRQASTRVGVASGGIPGLAGVHKQDSQKGNRQRRQGFGGKENRALGWGKCSVSPGNATQKKQPTRTLQRVALPGTRSHSVGPIREVKGKEESSHAARGWVFF